MKINLNLLPKVFDEDIIIPHDFYKGTSIKDLSKVKVVGSIKYNVIDEVVIDLDVSGEMLLSDAITNEPIKYPFSIKILENLAEIDENDAKYLEKSKNILDIIEFLWENIVLEVPIRITKSTGVSLHGDGWQLNEDENKDKIDPRFQKLDEFFKGGE